MTTLLIAAESPLPCGWQSPVAPYQAGRMKVLWQHYKTCAHPHCKNRLEKGKEIGRQLTKGMQ